MDNHGKGHRRYGWIELAVLRVIVFLGTEVVILSLQNRRLKEALAAMADVPAARALQPGDRVPSFSVRTFGGTTRPISLADSGQQYLLFVLSTNCPHCENNLAPWNAIAQHPRAGVTVLGVSTDDPGKTRTYASAREVGFYVASVVDTSFDRDYKVIGVPETILLRVQQCFCTRDLR